MARLVFFKPSFFILTEGMSGYHTTDPSWEDCLGSSSEPVEGRALSDAIAVPDAHGILTGWRSQSTDAAQLTKQG
jgi:hypothetical protein